MSHELPNPGLPNGELSPEIRDRAMWMHLAGVGAVLVGFMFYWISLLIPYFAWRSAHNDHPFIEENGRHATNFHISMAIYATIFWLLALLIALSLCGVMLSSQSGQPATDGASMLISVLWIVIVAFSILQPLSSLLLSIYGAIKAKQGQIYRYPFTIQFLKSPG